MRLADFERIDDGDLGRFFARVADAGGTEELELGVAA
jgi:hypothetical protein